MAGGGAALQRAAGNRAVARLLQRSPQTWARHAAVATIGELRSGWALTSFWPPIQNKTSEYGKLRADDRDARWRVLAELEAAIGAWEKNQEKRSQGELETRKRSALKLLRDAMDEERAELDAVPGRGSSAASLSSPPTSAALHIGRPSARPITEQSAPVDDLPSPAIAVPRALPAVRGTLAGESPGGKPTRAVEKIDFKLLSPTPSDALPVTLHVRVHFTKEEYLPDIHEKGLVPGAKKGIGLPTESGKRGKGDPHHVYAVDPAVRGDPTMSNVSLEAGGEAVVVVSRSRGDRDTNYEGSQAAVRYPGAVPPVRVAGQPAAEKPSAYSFALPFTPRSKSGFGAYVRSLGSSASDDDAERLLKAKLKQTAPLYFHKVLD